MSFHRARAAIGSARSVARKILAPIERFLRLEAAGGLLLVVAAASALLWANSRHAGAYFALVNAELPFGWSLGHFVSDGLMTVFFLVVGLELRREMHSGELADLRRATLPIFAAVGGMLVPAALFLLWTREIPELHRGFGVPMATDIAFAVGVLALLGKRVPPALRVLLLALAIIDDIGAILVIALFYSSGLKLAGIVIALGGIAAVLALRRLGVRRPLAYVVPGAIVWLGTLKAGIHPTIAGVALGLLTPVHALRQEANAPVVSLEESLHGWVSFGILPVFAFMNAGVAVSLGAPDHASSSTLVLGIIVSLVLGKPIGVALGSAFGMALGLYRLPAGVSWRGILLVGSVAGIGFTMAIFIAGLAFPVHAELELAKLGVLVASLIASTVGLGIGLMLPEKRGVGARNETEAELSAEM